ncbi:MAG: DUF1566 domain-containing protein [Colwellia sp.]|nr:DUF1566 domain-containing protein [Colwellia sp.]
MKIFKALCFIWLSMILISCGGGGGQSIDKIVPVDTPVTPPVGLAVAGFNQLLDITWKRVDGASSYSIYFASEPNVNKDNYMTLSDGNVISGVASNAFSIAPLENGKTYYLSITAVNLKEESSNSYEVSVTPNYMSILNSEVNDTGQTGCFDGYYNMIDCGDEGALIGGDSSYGRDALMAQIKKLGDGPESFDFTKLDIHGGELPYESTSHSCVKDNVTGLLWEIKKNDEQLHHYQALYSYYSTDKKFIGDLPFFGIKNGGVCEGSDCDTESFINAVNDEIYCGYTDWRVPTVRELNTFNHVRSHSIDNVLYEEGIIRFDIQHEYSNTTWTSTVPFDALKPMFMFYGGRFASMDFFKIHNTRLVRGSYLGANDD